MKQRLNSRLTKVLMAVVLVSSFLATPQADAVGVAKQAQIVKPFTKFESPFKLLFFETQQKERLEKQRLQAEYETKIKEERTAFLKIVKQKDTKYINLKTPSGLTADEIENVLEGTQLAGLGKAFANAEKTYKINAYYLIAHAAWESAWGASNLAKDKNNLFGFSAYDDSAYDSGTSFSTKSECIDTVAAFISEHYLSESGDHYNGATLKGMNKKYASDQKWAQGIADTMVSLVEKNPAL